MVAIADETEINAFVIDIKDDHGKAGVRCRRVRWLESLGLIDAHIRDIDGLIDTLRKHDITPIARLVAFQDNALAEASPDLAVQSKKGGIWKRHHGASPTRTPTIMRCGSTRSKWLRTRPGTASGRSSSTTSAFRAMVICRMRSTRVPPESTKSDAIAGFLGFARERLEKLGVWVSADVFGLITTVKDDQGIGQQFEKISRNVDIICPMVYPSHYEDGSYGIDSPNTSPYELVTARSEGCQTEVGRHGCDGPSLAAGLLHARGHLRGGRGQSPDQSSGRARIH